jgi:uncharacterized membrane protein
MTAYLFLKWLHVLAAITALGSNITYSIWLQRARQAPQALSFTLQTIRFIDLRLANPAYAVSLITGILMIIIGKVALEAWLQLGIALYFAVFLVGMLWFGPRFRRQIRLAEAGRGDSAEYAAAARQGAIAGMMLIVIVVGIVFLMVTKPAL